MVFACTQENLLQGVQLVSHLPGKNVNLPVLSNVLLKTDGGNLTLSTTNLEMAVSTSVRGRVEEEGEFTVPAKLFLDYISLLPSGKVELVVKEDILEVCADEKSTKIKGIQASEFPLIPKLTKGGGYRLSAVKLRQAIGQVSFAVSTSESRPELSGVACFFHGGSAGQNHLVMAATDSYRLAEKLVPLSSGSGSAEMRCIVPARAIVEISRILSVYSDDLAMPEEAEWLLTDSQLVLTFGKVELVSRLIEGSFPDYQQIIPGQFRSVITVPRGELTKAIRAAALFARQGLFDVHFELAPEGLLKVSSADTGTGSHTTTLKVAAGQEVNRVTLNSKYVLDGLAAMTSDTVLFQMIDAMSPVVIKPVGQEDFQYVVMPIRQ
ncbi:MAG: DNA polymerase III subunit beta [Candidatus Uhrbacteria bacterium]|nr:DNA polymerase III subunit beta [Candidatus Uhrbacteria bacterium]